MKPAICCTVTRSVKGKPFVRSWRSRPGWISRIRRCSAGMPPSTKRKATGRVGLCPNHAAGADASGAEISRSAAESTLTDRRQSPLALVDMAFIAWRNLRLINRIATLYGH